MTVPPSYTSIGYGYQPYGYHPYGSADWAEEVLWKILPRFYRDDDPSTGDRLRNWIDTIKPLFQELRWKWEDFTTLWDADEIPLRLLPLLAYNVGMLVFEDKPEALQRSSVLHCTQLYLHKGTDKGYEIVAAFEGLVVSITPLWAWSCDQNALLTEEPPNKFMARLDEVPLDYLALDTIFDDRFAIWPYRLRAVTLPYVFYPNDTPSNAIPGDAGMDFLAGRCRTYKLRLSFEKPDDTEIEDYDALRDRLLQLLELVRPIHVEFETVVLDGPKASATWQAQLTDNKLLASSTWQQTVVGNKTASATWVGAVTATFVGP